MLRKLTAEWIGTFSLLATVVGSGIMAERLADGNVAIARGFSNTFAGIQPVDIAAFVGVQLLAACLAAFFFKWLLQE